MALAARRGRRIAALARLKLSPDEERTFAGQLSAILDRRGARRARRLGVEPMTPPSPGSRCAPTSSARALRPTRRSRTRPRARRRSSSCRRSSSERRRRPHRPVAHRGGRPPRGGRGSSRDLVEAALARIEAAGRPPRRVPPHDARASPRGRRRRRRSRGEGGRRSALDGVPIALKDIFLTKGVETTCASRILEGFVPPYDATVVERLEEARAVVVGKLSIDGWRPGSRRTRTARSGRVLTRTTVPGAARAAAPRRSPRARCTGRSAPTPAARSGCRPRSAASWA